MEFHVKPLSEKQILQMHQLRDCANERFARKVMAELGPTSKVTKANVLQLRDYFTRRGIEIYWGETAFAFNQAASRKGAREILQQRHEQADLIKFKGRFDRYLRQGKARRAKLNFKRPLAQSRIYLPFEPIGESATFSEVKSHLLRKGYRITDYAKGYATDDLGKQTFKIGKLIADDLNLRKSFEMDYTRFPEKLAIVLSDEPEDIMRMTTGRNWMSCMHIDRSHRTDPMTDIAFDTVVAYLIRKSDPDITAPLARASIKSGVSANWGNNNVIFRADSFYGLSDMAFENVIDLLADDMTRHYNGTDKPDGIFRNRRALYYETYQNIYNLPPSMPTERVLRELCVRYHKNENGDFVVTSTIDLSDKDLTQLPDLSNVIVEGDFYCFNNQLKSLKGAPKHVTGDFDCSENKLTSLIGGPRRVEGVFNCAHNQLKTLTGGPKGEVHWYNCVNNDLRTLRGAPDAIGDLFACEDNDNLCEQNYQKHLKKFDLL